MPVAVVLAIWIFVHLQAKHQKCSSPQPSSSLLLLFVLSFFVQPLALDLSSARLPARSLARCFSLSLSLSLSLTLCATYRSRVHGGGVAVLMYMCVCVCCAL